MNDAPVSGFERDAGSHTTIRLLYPEGAPHSVNEYRETTTVALVVFKSLDLDWLVSVVTRRPLVRASQKATGNVFYYHTINVATRASGPNCGSGGRWWRTSL